MPKSSPLRLAVALGISTTVAGCNQSGLRCGDKAVLETLTRIITDQSIFKMLGPNLDPQFELITLDRRDSGTGTLYCSANLRFGNGDVDLARALQGLNRLTYTVQPDATDRGRFVVRASF